MPDDGGDSFHPALHCRHTFEKYAIWSIFFFATSDRALTLQNFDLRRRCSRVPYYFLSLVL